MRKPSGTDFEEWMSMVYEKVTEEDGPEDWDFGDVAKGFLLARGVDSGYLGWELCSAFACGDRPRFDRWLRGQS